MKMTVNDKIYSNGDNAILGVRYLAKEDKFEIPQLVEVLLHYYHEGNDDGIVETAKLITCGDKRNRKIDQHEEIIARVIELIYNEVWTGDYITADSVADFCYYNGIAGRGKRGEKTFPFGAVRVAINRLVEKGVLLPTDKVIRTRCGHMSSCKVFKRV